MAADLLKEFEPEIEELTLVPSEGGIYEITVNGKLVFSKLKLGRHAEPGEVVNIVRKLI